MADGNVPSPQQLEFMQLLLEYGDVAIPDDDTFGLSVILQAAHGDGKLPDTALLDFLLERNDITRIEKIDALEMAGAVLLGRDENEEKFPLAFQYWRRALTLRLIDTEDCSPIYKTPLKSKSGQLCEWTTLDDLQRIEQQPDQRKVQSLLVRLRIMSGFSWRDIYQYALDPIHHILFDGPHYEAMSVILDLTWITMDIILRSDRPQERDLQDQVIGIIDRLNLTLYRLPEEYNPDFNSENLMKLVELVMMTEPSYMNDHNLWEPGVEHGPHGNMVNLYRMFSLALPRFPAELITEEATPTRISLLQLVNRDDRDEDGYRLLHFICRYCSSDIEALFTIRLLVKLGADLNVVNNIGTGVLHILAQKHASETRDATAHLLVELGAHLDMVNKEGMTAADLWFQANTPGKKDVADLPDWLQEGVPDLQCLSSRVIRRHKLPYEDGEILPPLLIRFVSLH